MPDLTACQPTPYPPLAVGDSRAMRRLEWVDVLRGLAIVLVVFGHTLGGLAASHIFSENDNHLLRRSYDWIYCFHMPAFFFASGLFVDKSLQRRGIWPFVDNKLRTLLYPYFMWGLLIWCVGRLAAGHINSVVTVQPWRMIYDSHIGYWFLYALFVMMLLFALLRSKFGVGGWFCIAIASYIADAWVTNSYSREAMPNLLHDVFANAIYFASGVVFARFFFSIADRLSATGALLAAIAGFGAMSGMFFFLHWNSLAPWFKIFPAIAGTLALFATAVAVSRGVASASIAFLGRLSLEIYLTATFAPIARLVIFSTTHTTRVLPYILGCMTLGLGLPLLLVWFVDMTGWTWIFRLPDRSSPKKSRHGEVGIESDAFVSRLRIGGP